MKNNNIPVRHKAIILGPEGPNHGAEGFVTNKFFKTLEEYGWDIKWIYHQTDLGSNNDNVKYIGIKNRFLYTISHIFKNIPILKKIARLDSLLWVIKAYFKATCIIKQEQVLVVFSRIMPAYGHLPALLLAKKYRITWIANWSDPMPRIKAPHPYGKGSDAKISFLSEYYLKQICKYASFHSFPSDFLKKHYQKYIHLTDEKCIILPHIALPETVEEEAPHEELIISHIGGGLQQRNPTLFLQALANVIMLKQFKSIKIKLQFIGSIESDIESVIRNTSVFNLIELKGKVSYSESINYIKHSDIILVLEAQMETGIFLPSKIADIVACHKPIFAVSPLKGTVQELLYNYGGGIFSDCQSQSSIENGLKKLFEDWNNNNLSHPLYDTNELLTLFSSKTIYSSISNLPLAQTTL